MLIRGSLHVVVFVNCETRPDGFAETIPAVDCGIGPVSVYKYLPYLTRRLKA